MPEIGYGKRKKGFIFILSGPSGSGKTTLVREVLKCPQLRRKFIKSVSFTTRPRRRGERQGQSYFFVSPGEFQRLLKLKKILEHTHYLGYHYGTPRAIVEQAIKKGLHILLCLDVRGATFLKRRYPTRTVTIFIKPPSLSAAKVRILGRDIVAQPGELNRRLRLGKQELSYANKYDYCLINDNLKKAVREVKRIIQWTISP